MRDPRKRIVADGYDRLAARYLEWAAEVTGDPRATVLARFTEMLPDGGRVLDLGCGAGVPTTRELAARFRLVGVDISAAQIARARRNVPNAEFVHADFVSHDFPPASFDGVAALYSITHVPREQHASVFANVHRWLVPGGVLVAALGAGDSPDWTGSWLGDEMFFSHYDADENRRLLTAAGFELRMDEVVTIAEPQGPVTFLWVIGQKRSA